MFGKLTYDIAKDQFSIDKPLGFLQGPKELLVDHFKTEQLLEVVKTAGFLVAAGACLGACYVFGKRAFNRMRQPDDREKLQEVD